ncbi:MAG: orotidine-5'-phosphate decarboxylase [Flavobacteriales bacterium]
MKREELIKNILDKKSCLCVGLDPDVSKIPTHLNKAEDIVFEFNKAIIDATHDVCVAYKLNTAFYEALGVKGWISLEKTISYIRSTYPKHFTIADAKRGDIGNTSAMYAKAFFEKMDFHAVTVAPYMGEDSVTPFLSFTGKWVILLALTSNQGASDFQLQRIIKDDNERSLYEEVIQRSKAWGNHDRLMYVTGATQTEYLKHIRSIIPNHFLLIPGVGAQGGDLKAVCDITMNKDCGVLINSSRDIIYASNGTDFADKAREKAVKLQKDLAMHMIHMG